MRIILNISIVLFLSIAAVSAEEPSDNSDSIKVDITAYSYNPLLDKVSNIDMDTMYFNFHQYNPIYKNTPTVSFLGNMGSASQAHVFKNRPLFTDFIFSQPYTFYFISPNTYNYFNTKTPFTDIFYSSGEDNSKIESVRVIHTQNAGQRLNLGFDLRNISSVGQYDAQKTGVNNFVLFSHFEEENYILNANFALNSVKNEASGGLVNDSIFEQSDDRREDFQVNFPETGFSSSRNPEAVTNLKDRRLSISHSYDFSLREKETDSLKEEPITSFKLIHDFRYSSNRKVYQDNNGMRNSFYDTAFISLDETNDSLWYKEIYNRLRIKIPGLSIKNHTFFDLYVGASHSNTFLKNRIVPIPNITTYEAVINQEGDIEVNISSDTTYQNFRKYKYFNTGVEYLFTGVHKDKWDVRSSGKMFLLGHRQGNIEFLNLIEGNIANKVKMDVYYDFKTYQPSAIFKNFQSNYFLWNYSFDDIWYLDYGVDLKWKDMLSGGASLTGINNYVYFDTSANPNQYADYLRLLTASVSFDVNKKHIGTSNQVVYQKISENKALYLPDLSVYHSLFFNFNFFKDVLKTSIGYNLRYFTSFYAPAYMPATGVFYNQNEKKIGNYPFVDIFVNAKVKTARFFVKYEHVNAGFPNNKYYTTLHYPSPIRVVRFGLSWIFYN